MNSMLNQALNYAQNHFKIFPLNVNSKNEQILKSWKKEATDDIHQIELWWSQNPCYNIGIRTGDGLIVIDVDNKNNKNGKKSIESYIKRFPKTKIVRTPNDGWHFYYYVDRQIPCRVNLYEGIDVRGEGGYVVGAGSQMDDRKYFVSLDVPIAEANEAVYQFLEGDKTQLRTVNIVDHQINEGERNDTLFRMATVLKAKGLSFNSVLAAIKEENKAKCVPVLDDKEIFSICNSVEQRFLKRDDSKEYHPDDEISTYLKSVEEIQTEKMEWIVENLIPKDQITIFAGDGGVGKTSIWIHFAACLSTGKPLFFEQETHRKELSIVYFSGEDPTGCVLKRKLLESEGNIKNIHTIELGDERLRHIRFGSRYLENVIQDNRPDVIIFDPLQSFLPEHTNMSARNQMRDALGSLLYLARKYHVTFLIMSHTNKKLNAAARERAADSADIWDIARSFLFVGLLNDDVRYLSNEKNNYAPLQKTYLFSIKNSSIEFKGTSDKRDQDFQNDKLKNQRSASSQSLAKEDIISLLKNGEQTSKELELLLNSVGYSPSTIDRARRELRKEKIIDFRKDGSNREGNKQETIYFLIEKE